MTGLMAQSNKLGLFYLRSVIKKVRDHFEFTWKLTVVSGSTKYITFFKKRGKGH